MPADLIEAVTAWLEKDPVVRAALADGRDGIWADQAPEGTRLPYLVEWKVDETSTFESQADDGSFPYDDEGEVQVSIFAPGKSAANAIARAVRRSLNDAPLTFDDGALLLFRAEGKHTVLEPERGPDGVDVWQAVTRFKCLVSRTL